MDDSMQVESILFAVSFALSIIPLISHGALIGFCERRFAYVANGIVVPPLPLDE
jgi:hypothetical protein